MAGFANLVALGILAEVPVGCRVIVFPLRLLHLPRVFHPVLRIFMQKAYTRPEKRLLIFFKKSNLLSSIRTWVYSASARA